MSEFDSKALSLARQVMALTRQKHIGGDVQLLAKIQCLFVEAMEYAAPQSNSVVIPDGLVQAMQAAISQLDRQAGRIGHGYPQHCHTSPHVWDQGNRVIGHEPCTVCNLWDEMRAFLSAAPGKEG